MRDSLRRLAHSIRAIPDRQFGIRPYTVSVVLRTWSGSYTGDGSPTDTETSVTEANGAAPKVRWLDGEERALNDLPEGSLEVGPITPDFAGGGTSIGTLTQTAASSQDEVLWKVTGPEFPSGALFRVADVTSHRALHYTVRLKPLEVLA